MEYQFMQSKKILNIAYNIIPYILGVILLFLLYDNSSYINVDRISNNAFVNTTSVVHEIDTKKFASMRISRDICEQNIEREQLVIRIPGDSSQYTDQLLEAEQNNLAGDGFHIERLELEEQNFSFVFDNDVNIETTDDFREGERYDLIVVLDECKFGITQYERNEIKR